MKLIFVLTTRHILPSHIIQFPTMLMAFNELEVFRIKIWFVIKEKIILL